MEGVELVEEYIPEKAEDVKAAFVDFFNSNNLPLIIYLHLFFDYSGVIFGFGIRAEKGLLIPLTRGKLATRKPLPLGWQYPVGSGFDHINSHSAVRNERTYWGKRWPDSFECGASFVG